MALFAEYAVTPDVFDLDCYSNPDKCDEQIQVLKDAFTYEGVVRDLRSGDWSGGFANDSRCWHRRVRELLRKLKQRGRLILRDPALTEHPETDHQWCEEALASHSAIQLNGIIVNDAVANDFKGNALISSVNRLSSTNWWSPLEGSHRPNRNIEEYKATLATVLRHANSIMFIDPNIDPDAPNYGEFIQLLEAAGNRSPMPRIEIHRKLRRGSGQSASLWDRQDMEEVFNRHYTTTLSDIGLEVEIFVWDDLHDRYLISNLVGISVQWGFDTSRMPQKTTWARIGRDDSDDVQREFDPTSGIHKLQFSFKIP